MDTRAQDLYGYNYQDRGPWNPLQRINRSQAQQVVDWLDQNHPGWDRNIYDEMGFIEHDEFMTWFVGAAAEMAPHWLKKGQTLKSDFKSPVAQDKKKASVKKAFLIAAWTILAGLLIVAALFYLLPR